MSHNHLRSEKVCLNCGASIQHRYCSVCGQENTDPRESAWHLVRHFFEDITHFDGKFFKSLKLLFTKPGFLAEEYMKGRRASYLHPIRMYLLSTAVFFLILFSFIIKLGHYDPKIASIRDTLEQHNTSTGFGISTNYYKDGKQIDVSSIHFDSRYKIDGKRAYDSIQSKLPDSLKDNAIEHFIDRRMAAAATIYHRDPNYFMESINERFFHSFSKVFLISLPLCALMLQLLYIRRRKFSFVAHATFSIYYFCAFVIIDIFFLCVNQLLGDGNIPILWLIVNIASALSLFIYLYVAMLRFYGQGWFKTFIKFVVLSVFLFSITFTLILVFWLDSLSSIVNV